MVSRKSRFSGSSAEAVSGGAARADEVLVWQGLMIFEMLSGINPFKVRNKTRMEKLQMITERDIEVSPEIFSEAAASLLTGLLKRNVSRRTSANGRFCVA